MRIRFRFAQCSNWAAVTGPISATLLTLRRIDWDMRSAVELVSDRETRAPLPKDLNAFERLVDLAYAEGLIVYSRRSRGTEGDHFLVCPPMIATEAHVDEIVEKLTTALTRFAAEAGLPA